MPTFKIILAYDGTQFVGWQRQASGTSIQGLLEDALAELDQRDVAVTGGGRTDAGVHALGQAAGSETLTTTRVVFSSRIVAGLKPCATFDEDARLKSCATSVEGRLIVYEIAGTGFLRHMVRNIVGTLVEIGRGRHPVEWMSEVLASRDRARAGPTAPAEGLVLVGVEYAAPRGTI